MNQKVFERVMPRITKFRKAMGWSQVKMALIADVPVSTYAGWENLAHRMSVEAHGKIVDELRKYGYKD